MKKWVKVSLIGLSLILLSLAALAWFTLMTAPGARLALGFAESRIPGALSYEELKGRLVGPLELEGVNYVHAEVDVHVRVERLTVDWQPLALLERRLHIERLHLQGVDGGFDPEALSGRGDQEAQRHPGEGGGAEDFSARATAYSVEFDDLRATEVRFSFGDRAAAREASLAATGTLDAFAVEISGQLIADPLPPSRVALAGSGSLMGLALDSLTLSSSAGVIDASGELEWRPEVTWQLVVRGDSLAPGALADRPEDWPGWLALEASSRGFLVAGSPTAQVAIDTIHGSVRGYPVSGRAALDIEGRRILVPDTDLEWGPLAIRAEGVYADTVDVAFEIQAPDLSGVLPGGRGSVRAEGRAAGPRTSPHVEASLRASGVAYGDMTLQSAEGRVVVDLSPSGAVDVAMLVKAFDTPWVVVDELDAAVRGRVDAHQLSLRARSEEYAIALRAAGGVTGEVWRGAVEELEVGTLRVGEWSLQEPVSLALSRGTVSLGDLCLASAEGGICASGEFDGGDSWRAVASLEGIPLSLARPFLPADVTVTGTVDGLLDFAASETALPVGRAEISLSDGYAELVHAEDTVRVLHRGTLTVASSADGLVGDLGAAVSLPQDGGAARLEVGLDVPGTISRMERETPLGTLAGAGWRADLSVEGLQLSRLEMLLPEDVVVQGSLDASLNATAEAGRVRGTLVAEPSGGTIVFAGETDADSFEFRELLVRLEADATGTRGEARFSLQGLGGHPLGDLDVEMRSDPIVLGRPLTNRTLGADIRGTFDLATVTALTHGFVEATGSADLDFSLWRDPNRDSGDFEALGQARVKGRAVIQALGIALEDLELSLDAEGERLAIDGRVTSGEGHLSLSGRRLQGEATVLELQGERFLAIARDELRLEVNPDLRMEANGTRVDLSGEVLVPSARLELLEVPDTGVGVSDDVVLVGVETESEIRDPTIVEVFTDVTLSLGDQVSFQGLGLTTMIDGSLRVTDRPGEPNRADGLLTLRGGRFRRFGLNLVVDPGEMIFSGPIDEPRLRITAYRQADDGTRAGVSISGPADSPRLDVYSEPRLSDEEAFSYMFSGQPLDRGSTQLNRANAQQARAEGEGAIIGSNVLTQAAGMAIGLDETRIDAGRRREDAQFIAGKYVSPRLYVAYVTGLFDAVNVLRIRYTLYKGFRLQVEAGTRETADLLYRFDVGN